MADVVTVTLLVPADRIREFDLALGALVTGAQPPAPGGGSSAETWQEVSVVLAPGGVASFYAAFATWLEEATTPATPLAPLDTTKLEEAWNTIPRRERKFLSLCSDNFGRSIGWLEVKRKLGLAGKPSLTRDLPRLARFCAANSLAFPVAQDGDDDDAVFTLSTELVDAVRTFRSAGKLSATA